MAKSKAELEELIKRIEGMSEAERLEFEKKQKETVADWGAATKYVTRDEGKSKSMKAAIYGRYVIEKKLKQFEEDTATAEFNIYLEKNSERKIFGFEPSKTEKKN